jgi:dTDP-glucose 4,6-dehydratase
MSPRPFGCMETRTVLPDLVSAFADAWERQEEKAGEGVSAGALAELRAQRAPDRAFGRLLVTGGAGFIGSDFVRIWLREHPDSRIVVLDKLTYAGNPANLATCRADPDQSARLELVVGDITDHGLVRRLVAGCDAVINFAAESHVDRSIHDAEAFLRTGVNGVHALLEAVRRVDRPVRFLQVSTDEVYGSVNEERSHETDRICPRSPYAAAKAAGELLVQAYVVTHGIDAVTTRGSNTYGPYHYPEKVIPLFITNAIDGEPLPLYGDGLHRRDWLHVDDHVRAIETVLRSGPRGGVFNVPGGCELTNLALTRRILAAVHRGDDLIRHVTERRGHDRRYRMDGSRIAALGWRPGVPFEDGLAETVAWYRANEAWWRPLRNGDWDQYYARQYGARLEAAEQTGWQSAPDDLGDGEPSADG